MLEEHWAHHYFLTCWNQMKASWASAVADNLCTNPWVKHLKPHLNYTETHHLCLDSLLRYSLRKDKGICPGFYYTVLDEQVHKSDFSAVRKKSKEEEKKSTRINCQSSHFLQKTSQESHSLYWLKKTYFYHNSAIWLAFSYGSASQAHMHMHCWMGEKLKATISLWKDDLHSIKPTGKWK